MSAIQESNPPNVDLLSAYFPRRRGAEFAWGNVVSIFQMASGLRGLWTMASRDQTGAAYDTSGQGRTLTRGGATRYSYSGLIPRAAFTPGTLDYLFRADEPGLDILGSEAFEAHPGLTVGGWYYPAATTNLAGYAAKYTNVAATSAFALHQSTAVANAARFAIYNGGVVYPALSAANAASLNAWHFIWGRFVPSTQVDVGVDGAYVSNVAGIPATITNSPAAFEIGRLAGALVYFSGSASLCFLYGSALSDTMLFMLRELSAPLFGVTL